MSAARPCPCGALATYAECCRPLHRGEGEASTAEALMRSRFAAFASGEVEYLARTLHPEHPDASAPDLLRGLRDAVRRYRYMRLEILRAEAPGPDGLAHVTFRAQVFEKGKDRSFVERSAFARHAGAWRYLSGAPDPS